MNVKLRSTPSCWLTIRRNLKPCFYRQIRDWSYDSDQMDSRDLNIRVQYMFKVKECLKVSSWREYLALLIDRSKERLSNSSSIGVGDVVLIGNDNTKRIIWPLEVVAKLFSEKARISRVSRLKTASVESTWPIRWLY